jgi:hypothetical protein
MDAWEDVQGKKARMQKEVVDTLDDAEKAILSKVLELEWRDRHLTTQDVRTPLRTFITQEVK